MRGRPQFSLAHLFALITLLATVLVIDRHMRWVLQVAVQMVPAAFICFWFAHRIRASWTGFFICFVPTLLVGGLVTPYASGGWKPGHDWMGVFSPVGVIGALVPCAVALVAGVLIIVADKFK